MSTKRGYKATLIKVRELRGQSGLAAYDRAKMLVEVFNDRDFRAEAGNVDDFKAAEELDQYVNDLCLSFLELKAMLEHFPTRTQWGEGMLKRMHAEMLAANKVTRDKPTVTRPRITREEFDELAQEKAKVETRAAYLEKDVSTTRSRLQELEEENAELKRELARAEGRIAELERMMDRHAVQV